MYKGNVGGFRGDIVKIFPKPMFCFGHNLAISHPN